MLWFGCFIFVSWNYSLCHFRVLLYRALSKYPPIEPATVHAHFSHLSDREITLYFYFLIYFSGDLWTKYLYLSSDEEV